MCIRDRDQTFCLRVVQAGSGLGAVTVAWAVLELLGLLHWLIPVRGVAGAWRAPLARSPPQTTPTMLRQRDGDAIAARAAIARSQGREKDPQSRLKPPFLLHSLREIEVPGSEDEQVLAPTDGVDDGELAGRRDCRVEEGRGDMHRLLDEASCHGCVVQRQGLHDLRVLLRESLHRCACLLYTSRCV